ncbi:hypothetical protein EYF80_028470 [Liparis tanakae]|uniref:Uncharacterized protein n=1 Tax=Liparis tanakae TaxID=230148 RepID=A0A4Z2H8J5_9TELE|nr:hypothetical protein EYF80_028470 [Liparis tanakae]
MPSTSSCTYTDHRLHVHSVVFGGNSQHALCWLCPSSWMGPHRPTLLMCSTLTSSAAMDLSATPLIIRSQRAANSSGRSRLRTMSEGTVRMMLANSSSAQGAGAVRSSDQSAAVVDEPPPQVPHLHHLRVDGELRVDTRRSLQRVAPQEEGDAVGAQPPEVLLVVLQELGAVRHVAGEAAQQAAEVVGLLGGLAGHGDLVQTAVEGLLQQAQAHRVQELVP